MANITKNKQTPETLLNMVQKAFGSGTHITACSELTEGFCNIAYRMELSNGTKCILKISPDKDITLMTCETALMQTEVAAMKYAQQKKCVKTADIYFYDNSRTVCSGEYFFMEILNGTNLYQLQPELTDAERKSFSRETGKVLHNINQETGTQFGHFCVSELQYSTWYKTFKNMIDGICGDGEKAGVSIGIPYKDIRAALPLFQPYFDAVQKPSFIHFDSWNGNIFVNGTHITGLIDWERAMWADPLMEDQFRAHEITPDFLVGYGITELTAAEKTRCRWYDIYLYLIMMIEGTYRHYETNDQYNWAKSLFTNTWNTLSASI